MAEKDGMFKDVMQAVENLMSLCAAPGACYEKGKPLVATEVYNEGWMLRLVVAKLSETTEAELRLSGSDEQLNVWIRMLCNAAKEGWCSEGRVFPLFSGENSTCADGIVGNISLRKGKNWGFECRSGNFAILEAKMGSALSAGVKNDKTFDQAARNVACAAGMEGDGSIGHFFVFAPEESEHLGRIIELVGDAAKNAIKHIENGTDGHSLRDEFTRDEITARIRSMKSGLRIGLIKWESLLEALPYDEFIDSFYTAAKRANGIG